LDLLNLCKGITCNSKEVREGFLFFAIKGSERDGNEFIEEALSRGALFAITDSPIKHPKVIRVEDARKSYALACNIFYGKPCERLKVVGVTGTNGKTTVTYIIESILRKAGYKTGVIGTINYRIENKKISEGRTTPPPEVWFKTLSTMAEKKVDTAVAEVSSHALDQHRIRGTTFDAVIFTNLSQDHLDYHKDMENYFNAKARLFREYSFKRAYINTDDPYGRMIYEELKKRGKKVISFGKEGSAKIEVVSSSFGGINIRINYRNKNIFIDSPLCGDFQAYNITAGVAYCIDRGVDPGIITEALRKIKVPGRFETIDAKGRKIIIDYAHTPDALKNVLVAISKIKDHGRIITVFGAGGNRDRSKRPLMGRIAEEFSNIIVLTSDNPRYEDPMRIIEDILSGIENKDKVFIKEDREEAIKLAFEISEPGDTILIAGKGHEDYQEVRDRKIKFSDKEVVYKLLK